jgi:methylated-DNA-[protein]-cysteine S-methyltransferase
VAHSEAHGVVVMPSPVGPLGIEARAGVITRITFHASERPSPATLDDVVVEACRQLNEYFEGRRKTFSLPLAPEGTAFQCLVWQALTEVAYGETVSYSQLAQRIGRPLAVRAVGAANGQNPIPIVIPCHRVIGADGRLVGFGGGLGVKQYLLGLERGSLF